MLVELMREHQTRPRASGRDGCRKLLQTLPKWFPDAEHVVEFEGLREHYKVVARAVRAGTADGQEAQRILNAARERRKSLGWDTSAWLLIADPQKLREMDTTSSCASIEAAVKSVGVEIKFVGVKIRIGDSARGHSLLKAAADTEIEVSANDTTGAVTNR